MQHERIASESLTSKEIPHPQQTIDIYQRAFAGFPWFESLTQEEVQGRIEKDVSKKGFEGVWVFEDTTLVSASWYYDATAEYIEATRGRELKDFIDKLGNDTRQQIIWQSMTLVAPEYQFQGVGLYTKGVIDSMLQEKSTEANAHILYLTRIRDDNVGSIKMNEAYGMQRTGITVPSSQVEGLNHSYWYKVFSP